MAAQPTGEANQQLWDDTLRRLLNLSSTTVQRNADLESRIAELEIELSVWKQAHAVALEATEREAKAHNVRAAALNRQIANLDGFKTNYNPLILCVINGDENIFIGKLLSQGCQGGRTAAQQLTKAIAEHLSSEEVHVYGRLSFWITIFFNKSALLEILLGNSICSQEQFEAFLSGFSQSSPRFSLVDVGCNNNDGVESKIRGDGTPFTSIFAALEKEQVLGKLIVIQNSRGPSSESQPYPLPSLMLDNIFVEAPLRPNKRLSPLSVGPFNAITANCGLISPQSPTPQPTSGGQFIDPSLPLFTKLPENPPPCNEHYLMTCSKGSSVCKYSHGYILTSEQLASLATNAKKAPCNWLKNG
ncbi:hypothetical protein BDQ17DRAFT_1388607 [Cyathus striatus]|nr:hypothetical protein BDQ17DRAFT_1388607 [Cyathus striatus]